MKSSTALSSLPALGAHATPLAVKASRDSVSVSCGSGLKFEGSAAAVSSNTTATSSAANITAAATNSFVVLPGGRIAQSAVATDFSVLASVFKSAAVKGDGLVFSDLIQFPNTTQSLVCLSPYSSFSSYANPDYKFDTQTDTKAFEVTISDKSIFVPQVNNVPTTGIKTMHLSLQTDATKSLNTSHDYQVAFLETADFATHQFDVRLGTQLWSATSDRKSIVVNGNNKAVGGVKTLFSAPITEGHTIQDFHSMGNNLLANITDAVPNDMAGNGEYHFGVLKNAIAGFQPSGINEGVIFGGIFTEDSASGTVTLQ
ncbi:uncharacterized protein PAC_01865 [Phialocephala subalpina]|uniref:Glycoside hydrolase 131 catalytic N-terminal domain-containing protein n=1 Tax=Phialocephala subalpina TaxID=576137 RepID=A0A1L7WGV3_9HELO|nr:uncharacterized protein PAC_01865 [Phialocephala subalpina]